MRIDYDAAGALVGVDVQHASKKVDLQRLVVNHMPFAGLEAA